MQPFSPIYLVKAFQFRPAVGVKPVSLNSRKFNTLTPVLVARPNSRSNFNTSRFFAIFGLKWAKVKSSLHRLRIGATGATPNILRSRGVPPNCTARKQLQGLPPLAESAAIAGVLDIWRSGGVQQAFSKRLKRSPFSTWAKELQPRPHSLEVSASLQHDPSQSGKLMQSACVDSKKPGG